MNEYEYWHCEGCGRIMAHDYKLCHSCFAEKLAREKRKELESKAEIWDEGYRSGCRDSGTLSQTPNPYR